jgi:hypothetical protein
MIRVVSGVALAIVAVAAILFLPLIGVRMLAASRSWPRTNFCASSRASPAPSSAADPPTPAPSCSSSR